MGKLEDMRVERVDGVDKPATGHRWAIIKSEDATDTVEKDYAGAAKAAVEALLKEEGVTFTKETADALHALAALLEMSVEFKSEDAPEADEPEVTDEAPVTKGEFKSLLKDALTEVLAEELAETTDDDEVEKDDEEPEAPAAPKSRQPDEQDDVEKGAPLRGRVRKDGRPSFTNVIFNQ